MSSYYKQRQKDLREGVDKGFMAAMYLVLLGLYNTNAETKWLSNKRFTEFFIKTEKEVNRIFTEEYKNNPDDVAAVAMYHTAELRKKMGLEGF